MISRIWHGWTKPQRSDAYESLLRNEIFFNIQNRQIAGYRGIHLFRLDLGDEVEFIYKKWAKYPTCKGGDESPGAEGTKK
jgi:hypothetical protein